MCSNPRVLDPDHPTFPAGAWVALRRAGDLLAEAAAEEDRTRRYGLCRLSALHLAWAACAGAVGRRGSAGSPDPWTLLGALRPALAEWSPVFTAVESRWVVLRRGLRPTEREVDDLLREVTAFRRLVVATTARDPAGGRGQPVRRPGPAGARRTGGMALP